MGGMDYLKRHIKRLPPEQIEAITAVIEGRPHDRFLARQAARQLWAWNVVPATGLVE